MDQAVVVRLDLGRDAAELTAQDVGVVEEDQEGPPRVGDEGLLVGPVGLAADRRVVAVPTGVQGGVDGGVAVAGHVHVPVGAGEAGVQQRVRRGVGVVGVAAAPHRRGAALLLEHLLEGRAGGAGVDAQRHQVAGGGQRQLAAQHVRAGVEDRQVGRDAVLGALAVRPGGPAGLVEQPGRLGRVEREHRIRVVVVQER